MRHLVDITLAFLDGPTAGFLITFHFSPNEYFEDSVLTKEYRYRDDLDVEGDYLYERAVGCTIRWKEDKNLTQEIEVKRQRNKGQYWNTTRARLDIDMSWITSPATNRTRVVRRSKPADSFFNFFTPPEPVNEEEEEAMGDEEFKDLEESLEMDYQLGQDLKDRVSYRCTLFCYYQAENWC